MALPTDPYTFAAGDPAAAAEVNARFAALYAALSAGGLDPAAFADNSIPAAKMDDEAWTGYTPTVATATLGSGGGVQGRSLKAGRRVDCQGILYLGTGGSLSGSDVTVTLPYAAQTSMGQTGVAFCYDASLTKYVGGICVVETGAPTVLKFRVGDSALDELAASHPFAWGASDYLRWAITYEAAA